MDTMDPEVMKQLMLIDKEMEEIGKSIREALEQGQQQDADGPTVTKTSQAIHLRLVTPPRE